ncbi:MAG: hypothetical protein ACRD8O_21920 [Bryobacteraceae bacterium]
MKETYAQLAEFPGIGASGKIRQGKHAGVRLWQVNGFENYLIAYRPHRDGADSLAWLG